MKFVGIHLYTALSRSRYSISVGLRSKLWLGHRSTVILLFFLSVVDLLVCLGLLSCCMAKFRSSFSRLRECLTFDSRLCWYIDEFMVDSMTARCPGRVIAKQGQIIIPPLLCWSCKLELCCHVIITIFQPFQISHTYSVFLSKTKEKSLVMCSG